MSKIDRSGAGLRDALFDQLERLRDKKIEAADAKAFADVAKVIVDSARLQLEFERARLESEIPQHLSEMRLVPPLTNALDRPAGEPA